jgi:hypothetical protein
MYISCVDTAKMIRKALKEAFPEIKFSVVSSQYSGGASIDVRWIDGPNTSQVKAVAGKYSGAYFDGMQDYKGYTRSMIDGIEVSFGANFVFCNREYSDAAKQKAIDAFCRKYAGNLRDIPKPTLEQFKKGALYSVKGFFSNDYANIQEMIYEIMGKKSDRLSFFSPSANKVIYLGNDGYSQVGALSSQELLND